MIILGVDPGLKSMGYGVVEVKDSKHIPLDWGTIETNPKTVLADRLAVLYQGIREVIENNNPDVGAFEGLIFAQNVKSALALGQARGVAILAVSQRNLEFIEYSPKEVKKTICGQGNAGKKQVTQMVQALLGLRGEEMSLDAGDALGIAMSHALISKRKALIGHHRELVRRRGMK